MKVIVEFEDGDLDSLHDIVYSLTGESKINEHLKLVWNKLPDNLKKEAIHWGMDDSVVRDNIYTHLKGVYSVDTHNEDEHER